MHSEAPLTLILSPLRAGRGEVERTRLGSLSGGPDTVPRKGSLSLWKRVRVRVRLDCMDTAKRGHNPRRSRANANDALTFSSSSASWRSVSSPLVRGNGFVAACLRTIASVPASCAAGIDSIVAQYFFVKQGILSGSRVILS